MEKVFNQILFVNIYCADYIVIIVSFKLQFRLELEITIGESIFWLGYVCVVSVEECY